MSLYPNESKQLQYIKQILDMFINKDNIKSWYDKCRKNNLYYWIPILHKGKRVNYSFFLNLITNEKSYKIKNNDIIVIKYDNSNDVLDKIFSWNNNLQNIVKDENQFDIIMMFINNYIKCKTPMDLNDFNSIKELVLRCKDLLSSTASDITDDELYKCNNLISYQEIIKEIVKLKYPFKMSNNNDGNKIKKFENELFDEIPKI